MGYTVHNFQPNEVLHASELNEMDAQILKNVQNTATIQTTNKATKNFVVGEYLTYEGILYEVTSPIATGGTITPGSNCEQTNMGAELAAANTEIAAVKESLSTLVSFQAVVAETISVPHGDYLSLQDYRPKDRTNYTWHLVGALPSVGSIQIIGIDGSANRVMTLTDSKSTVSNAQLVLTWCGIHN